MITRIRPVLEWQYGNDQETANEQMSLILDYYGNGDGIRHVAVPHPVNYFLWGAGGATYYTSNNDSAASVDSLFASGIPNEGFGATCNEEADWAKAFGLDDVAYEGGWGVGNSNYDTTVQESARFDLRAGQSLIACENDFEQAGGDLDIFYASSGWLSWTWGTTANITDISTPLYDAVSTIQSTNPVPFANGTDINATPGHCTSVPTASFTVCDQWGTGNYPTLSDGHGYQGYLIEISRVAVYQFSPSVTNTVAGGKVGLYVDGSLVAIIVPTVSGPSGRIIPPAVIKCDLSAGAHGIVFSALKDAQGSSVGVGSLAYLECRPLN
jgi:hypothetical protein